MSDMVVKSAVAHDCLSPSFAYNLFQCPEALETVFLYANQSHPLTHVIKKEGKEWHGYVKRVVIGVWHYFSHFSHFSDLSPVYNDHLPHFQQWLKFLKTAQHISEVLVMFSSQPIPDPTLACNTMEYSVGVRTMVLDGGHDHLKTQWLAFLLDHPKQLRTLKLAGSVDGIQPLQIERNWAQSMPHLQVLDSTSDLFCWGKGFRELLVLLMGAPMLEEVTLTLDQLRRVLKVSASEFSVYFSHFCTL